MSAVRSEGALGILGIALGVGASAIGVFLLAVGIARQNQELVRGRSALRRSSCWRPPSLAVGAMEWALISHDFSIRYVAENNARSTPLLFTITGLWAALEGSILLWVLILAGYIAVMARRFRSRLDDPMVAWALLVALAVALLLLRLHGRRREPVPGHRRATSRSTGAGRTRCCRTTRSWRSTRRCSTSGYVGLHRAVRVRDGRADHRPLRRGLAGRHPAHDARRVGLPHRRASCSARGGATRCSAGAATGAGTRSRTRRCCRG